MIKIVFLLFIFIAGITSNAQTKAATETFILGKLNKYNKELYSKSVALQKEQITDKEYSFSFDESNLSITYIEEVNSALTASNTIKCAVKIPITSIAEVTLSEETNTLTIATNEKTITERCGNSKENLMVNSFSIGFSVYGEKDLGEELKKAFVQLQEYSRKP